jgi:hypothetical protein
LCEIQGLFINPRDIGFPIAGILQAQPSLRPEKSLRWSGPAFDLIDIAFRAYYNEFSSEPLKNSPRLASKTIDSSSCERLFSERKGDNF